MPPPEQKHLHSAEYFGEQRNYWWNQDYLALIARRLELGRARRVLDVGSGIGHWGRAILPHLDGTAQIVGVDREPQWVQAATDAAAKRGLDGRVRYVVGEAERLPFADGEFDLVTCQTLLLHVRDYRAVVREMVRVLRPDGRLLLVEPNNLAGAMLRATRATREELEDRMRLARFQAVCEAGKEHLGEGNNSIGDRLPGHLAQTGLERLEVYQSDHAYPMIPPYGTPAQQAMRAQLLDWAGRGFWIWTEADTRRYFAAGGGDEREFEPLWRLALAVVEREAEELRRGTYRDAGGSVVYVISAIKPG
jgi:SAM-dependent methyltransferase